jgi:hypothetical protein
VSTTLPPAGRKSRPAPADYEAQARALVDGYISTLCGSRALKAGLRKALAKLKTTDSK